MSLNEVLIVTEEEQKAMRKSYDRTDEDIDEDIQSIKEWLKKQPHLPQDEEEHRLRMMLQYNKFSIEKTKNKLDMYYSLKHLIPEVYIDREPLNPQVLHLMDHMIVLPLPNLTPELNRALLLKIMTDDTSKFDMTVYMKVFFSMFDLIVSRDASLGHQVIIDMEFIRLGHMLKMTPVDVKKMVSILQKSYSDRLNGVHFLNVPSYAQPLVAVLNSILSEKLANRVHVQKDLKKLAEILSPKVVPNEFGGTAGPVQELYDNWKKYFRSQNDWLIELANKKSDESKRIGEPLDTDMFGMCGSFRKLNVD